MTVGYFTDNNVSHAVMKAFSRAGIKVAHIKTFAPPQQGGCIFYGILRGSGMAMRLMDFLGKPYWYVDNGYFDAAYMNKGKRKEMDGTYRIVKNALLETIDIVPHKTEKIRPLAFLLMPPSPYSAFMHDTTPEDWKMEWGQKIHDLGHRRKTRDKEEIIPLEDELNACDAVFAFNSMAVMKAIEMGKAVYTTHGIIRNGDMLDKCVPYYDIEDMRRFYETKQFTLDEIAGGKLCLI